MSTDDSTRAKIAAEAGCTLAYLDETIKILKESRWDPGADVDRDSVVEVLSAGGIALLELADGYETVEHKVDYYKAGSVFDA